MDKIKNIVIVNDFDYVQGGASKVAIDTANLLCDKYKVYFFTAVHSEESTLNKKVIKVCTNQNEALREKNKVKGFINGIYNKKAKKKLKELLNLLNKEDTIIHVHGWTKALSSSVFDIIFKKDFKLILTLHDYFTACPNGGYFNYPKNEICLYKPLSWKCVTCNCDSRNYMFKIYRIIRQFVQNKVVKLNKMLENVIVISDFSEKILRKTLNKNINVYKVYNPVDFDSCSKNNDFKTNKYYLYVGRVSKEKGVDIFCEAISKTKKNGIVVGDGPELNRLREKYKNINFVGWKSGDEVKKYMKNAKTLIFPSRWYEGAPLTPLEAMNYNIPVFVSTMSAATEYIKEDYYFSNLNELIDLINKDVNKFDCLKIDLKLFDKEYYVKTLINVYNLIKNK